ncbi:transposase [Amycolatopsis japonica]
MLKQLIETVIDATSNAEPATYLGHEEHQAKPVRVRSNMRNDSRSKTLVSDVVGEAKIAVPQCRESNFEPVIVKRRQPRDDRLARRPRDRTH